MSDYIRNHYQVPARRGQRIRFNYDTPPREGVITATPDMHLRVRFDDEPKPWKGRPSILHPTWEVEYLAAGEG